VVREPDQPVLLSKWYEVVKWLLERVDSFPKNQRFIFGTRLADRALGILEVLVEASYTGEGKAELLERANRDLTVLRWLVRLAQDRKVLTARQYEYCCVNLAECGRMIGGWLKDTRRRQGREA
jgi:hypothetical protein